MKLIFFSLKRLWWRKQLEIRSSSQSHQIQIVSKKTTELDGLVFHFCGLYYELAAALRLDQALIP